MTRWTVTLVALAAPLLASRRVTADDDAGDAGNAGAISDAAPSDNTKGVATACDGALCDTTNGSTCGVALGAVGAEPAATSLATFGAGLTLAAVLALGAARRLRHQTPEIAERQP